MNKEWFHRTLHLLKYVYVVEPKRRKYLNEKSIDQLTISRRIFRCTTISSGLKSTENDQTKTEGEQINSLPI
jgi:hypothetical protein